MARDEISRGRASDESLYQHGDARKLQQLLGRDYTFPIRQKRMDNCPLVPIPEHEWIPVTKEPPLKVGDDGYNGYLVYANGYYEVADYTTDKFDNVPYFHVNGEYEPNVTHWMPLPQPPKKDV